MNYDAGWSWYRFYPRAYRMAGGAPVPGIAFPAIMCDGDYFLVNLIVYQDSMVDVWGDIVTFETLKQMVAAGRIVTSVPDNAILDIHSVGEFKVTMVRSENSPSDLIKQLRGALDELNNRPTSQELFVKSVAGIEKEDTPQMRKQLVDAYEAMPTYYRRFTFGYGMHLKKNVQKIIEEELARRKLSQG